MKKILYFIAIIIISASCGNQTEKVKNEKVATMPGKQKKAESSNEYGKKIVMERVADVSRLPSLMESNNNLEIKVIGRISDVCQASGCWLDMDMGNGQTLHVTFKDEAFVVPKDITGKTAIVKGIATKEIIPVDMLKKIAADEGKSKQEIQKITQPSAEYSIEAVGLVIK